MTAIPLALRAPNQAVGTSIALITLAMLGGSAASTVLSPLQELMQADLGFTDNQVSLIQGAAMVLPLAVTSIPIGRWVDRSSRTKLLIALALLCAVGSALTALAHGFVTMFIARMMVGVSVGAALPAAVSLAADLTEAGRRSKAMALLGLGQVLGSGAAFVLAGFLLGILPRSFALGSGWAPLASWQLVQLLFSVLMLALALVLMWLREPPRQEVEQAPVGGIWSVVVELAAHRRVLLPLVIGMITINMADAAANIWAVPVLTRSLHQQPESFGSWMGMLLMGTGLAGVILGGFLGDYGQRLWGRPGILAAAALVAVISTPMALFPMMSNVPAFAVLFGLLVLLGTASGIIDAAAITVLIPNELRGISISLVGTIGRIVAMGLGPSLVSFVAQWTGYGDDIRVPLTIVGLVTGVISVIATLVAMRAARETMAT
jgi:MFS family permease